MRFCHNSSPRVRTGSGLRTAALTGIGLCAIALAGWQARAALPRWMQDVVGASSIEAALYRAMQLPGVMALYPRPPVEAQRELTTLTGKAPNQTELYSLRAMEDEQALDFHAAETDWKAYVAHASDAASARLELADYYHRRMEAESEVDTLMLAGAAGALPAERYMALPEQRSWKAFERIVSLAADQGMADDVIAKTYAAWIGRYPEQASLYAREFQWLLERRKYADASQLLAAYRKAFPKDAVFPVKAEALLDYRQGSVKEALQVYDAGFTPLWPAELVESYFGLLSQTHRQRAFLTDARARLAGNPDDLNAAARLFYSAQQQGNLESAQQVIDAFRMSKESRKAAWSEEELHTLAQLAEAIHAYPEAARYNFALYHMAGPRQAEGLSGLIRVLLMAPEQPIELGANNLSMYRDIATLDKGPGYWNGIASLWLNTTYPEQAFHEEERRAQPYFHRSKAAELLTLLDKDYPQAPERAALHALMIEAYADYGEGAYVLKAGTDYLANFPVLTGMEQSETDRLVVAMLMADAFARKQDTKSEFALYDRLLAELSTPSAGMPLTAAAAANHGALTTVTSGAETDAQHNDANSVSLTARAFDLSATPPSGVFIAGAQQYQTLLERYLGRLAATGQLPEALAVLRRELDRNPNDPLLYERLATFLEQNNLSAQQETVYQEAIQKFQEKGWYDKLARLYLREKKREAFADLTRKVTDIFHGSELEDYFQHVTEGGPQLFLQLNLYAHQRFPHDQVFIRNLLTAYQAKATRDTGAWEKLLREHWADSAEMRTEFFDYLSRNGKLDAELSRLHDLVPDAAQQKANPAATRELAEVQIWRSHFEESAPLLGSIADLYPAEEEIGTQASSLFRSLAYYDSVQTERAVAIEKHLLSAKPSDMDRLARIGDIYADSGATDSSAEVATHENLQAAAPYWQRMVAVHPGTPDGYLQAATVFWDYFQFDDALRLIQEARAKFNQPHLYGYEAGAIEEGKRDLRAAIGEYASAAADDAAPSNPAAARLMQLARRGASAKLVDDETARLAETGRLKAIELRLRVLKAQKREGEITTLLDAALNKASTLEQAEAMATQAQAYSLTPLYERALSRQVGLVTDPVQKIELKYRLAQSLEERGHMEEAARTMDGVYRENSKLLGVVRATTDFYWRNKLPARAIDTLVQAAKDSDAAQPSLSRGFVVEAASKANESGNYAQARGLMTPLLAAAADQYNAQYLGVVADSYARAGDNSGLKQFYVGKLDSIRSSAGLAGDERKQKTVLLRRGLIPALTRLKDYAGAVDQYIAILSAYPEDTATIDEASLYALRYARQPQLVEFVTTTVKASPRDSRFAIMLGQMQTTFENFPAAIDAYARAIAIRSDRSDVFTAKADLEERLQRFDDACKEYEQLYRLSYQNPEWLVKVATARARQGRGKEAVKALERAWAVPSAASHAPTAASYFRIATQLENWNMLADALRYAELGVKAEGDDLLGGASPGNQNGEEPEGATIYVRLLTRTHQQEKALAALDAASQAAQLSANSPSLVVQQVEKEGLASVTDSDWRKQRAEQRRQTAAQRYRSAVLAIGTTVATYFTPEEKLGFAKLLDTRWAAAEKPLWSERAQWIDVAHAAGVLDVEARYRKQILLDRTYEAGVPSDAQYGPYVALQRSRLEFAELAQTLEAYALLRKPEERAGPRVAAAKAWRDTGDEVAEMRALRRISFAGNRNASLRERYLELLLKHDPAAFQSFGSTSTKEAAEFAAPNYAVAHTDLKMAAATLHTHAHALDAVWQSAYTALLGLYFRDQSAVTQSAFHTTLGDEATIGQRVDTKIDRAAQLAGGVWFEYGMRYGVYRTLAPEAEWLQRDPEDFLAAGLERNPTAAASFITLARAYEDAGKPALALAEYDHALEIAPDSAAVRDAMAVLLWPTDKTQAVAQWRAALTTLNRIQDEGAAPESFWSSFALIARHLGARRLTGQLHPEMDALLRNYIARNGDYRSSELLEAAFKASASSSEGVAWMLSLSTAAINPAQVLVNLETAEWVPKAAREPILLRQLDLARTTAAREADGAPAMQSYRTEQMQRIRRSLAGYYLEQKMDAQAEALLQQMSETQRREPEMVELRIQLATRSHRLVQLLAAWASDSEAGQAPVDAQLLRSAAGRFAADGDHATALVLWEYVFERGQSNHDLLASDYLGLAEARLEVGNVPGALETLRRMAQLSGDAYANYDLAAAMLERAGHSGEAVEFLTTLARGVPWEAGYRLRLARAQLAHTQLAGTSSGLGKDAHEAAAALRAIAANAELPYAVRTQAAVALRKVSADAALPPGSAELQLIAGGKITAQQAAQPYFAAARIVAAQALPAASARAALLRQAIAISPDRGADAPGVGNLPLLLFHAEAEAGHNATALVLLETLQTSSYRSYAGAGEEDSVASESEGEGAADGPVDNGEVRGPDAGSDGEETLAGLERLAPLASLLSSETNSSDTAKLAMALEVAQVYEQTGAPGSAVAYLKLAARLETRAAEEMEIRKRLKQIDTTLTLEGRNSSRLPVIQRALEQSNVVRPKVSAAELEREEVAP